MTRKQKASFKRVFGLTTKEIKEREQYNELLKHANKAERDHLIKAYERTPAHRKIRSKLLKKK